MITNPGAAPAFGGPVGGLWRRGARLGPVRIVADLAVRNPRAALLVGGTLFIGLGTMVLLAVASIQAFLVMSGQSSMMADRRAAAFLLETAGGGESARQGSATAAASAALLAATPAGRSTTNQPSDPVGADEVVSIEGIRVHVSIADDVRALLGAAAADGIALSGWGWRDHQTQIRLRREHCGTSQYAIYEMPSSQCRPPTARPGSSQHERGLAIDFTYAGGSISSHRNTGYRWLAANAAAYGLKNLPSEPWHWSTTGR